MTTTLPKQIEQKIIGQLEDGVNHDDIILHLCETQGLDWNQAEAVVNTIRTENADNITLAQSPVLVIISLGIFIGGVVLIGYAAWQVMESYSYFQAISSNSRGVFAGFVAYLISYSASLLWMIALGTGMIIGSLRGMTEVWTAILSKLGL
jgi:hypothetical protein